MGGEIKRQQNCTYTHRIVVRLMHFLGFFHLPRTHGCLLSVVVSPLFLVPGWQDKLLRYLGWSLNDKASSVRTLALQVIFFPRFF